MQEQTEVITEEDLILIQERESAIRQLEVGLTTPQPCVLAVKHMTLLVKFFFTLVRHHGHK